VKLPQGGQENFDSRKIATKARIIFLIAAGLSFLLSVGLYFLAGDKQAGIYVGLWVPSILSAGILILGGRLDGK
jgi:hypothetical protein